MILNNGAAAIAQSGGPASVINASLIALVRLLLEVFGRTVGGMEGAISLARHYENDALHLIRHHNRIVAHTGDRYACEAFRPFKNVARKERALSLEWIFSR